jgi:phospholipid/cholesterol/gamma-HCH transport system substrate-binding protein
VTLLADKDERFKNLFGKAALFILLAALGIGAVFLWTGVKKGAFTAKFPIYFEADSGQDLSEGMPVKFSGFKIGKLNTLTLDEQGHVQVEVIIEAKYLKLIRQDAVISLKKEGVIGDGVLDISRGTESRPILAAGGKVRFERTNGLEQAVVDMKNRIVPILDDVHQILSDPNGDVRQTLKNLRQFSAEMQGTRKKLDQVLGSVDGNLNNEVGPLLRSLRQTSANAEQLSAKINHDLPELLKKADSGMENLRLSTESIKGAIQQSAPQLPAVVGKTREVLGTTQEAVDALSNTWPLKSAMPPPETGPVRMDSHD